MANPTPPQQTPLDIPDYYLGMLIDYEPLSRDNMHWVVYDGANKVRCISRQSAIAYINERRHLVTHKSTRFAALARYYLNHSCTLLDKAAQASEHEDRLLLEYLAVQPRPLIVQIDNYLQTSISNEINLSHHQD